MEDEEHIIDFYLRVTTPERFRALKSYRKKAVSHENRKHKIDDNIFYCRYCKRCWSIVPGWVDRAKFRMYPEGNMPTYKKKRKDCPSCK